MRLPSRSVPGALAMVVAALVPAAAAAHHGLANFDLNTEITIAGTITRLAFVNPHSWVYLDVTGEDGEVQAWRCELRGASVLRRSGWTPEMFAAGTRLTITGAPDRFEPRTCYFGTALFADGSTIDRYGQIARAAPATPETRPARTPDGVPNLAGDWAAEQRMLTDPRGMSGAFLPMRVAQALEPGAVPAGTQAFPGTRGTAVSLAEDPIDAYWNRPSAVPLTEAGARAIADFDGASADNPRLRCEITNILFDWTFEADVNQIVQTGDRLVLRYGTMGLERTIHLDGSGAPDDLQPSRAGYSVGRWEGDELVVETVGFLPGILSADGRVPHSDQLRVVERFTLDPAQGALVRRYVAEDPLYLQGEYTGGDVVYPADTPYLGTVCDDRSFKSSAAVEGEPSRAWLLWAGGGLLGAIGLLLLTRRLRTRTLIAAGTVAVLAQALHAQTGTGPWTAPRTPWGDPDLQGIYTNANEYGTPLERPAEFAGRSLDDVTSEELARVRAQATPRAVAALQGGEVRGPDDWWLPLLDLARRNQPWLIVDPADGQVPALTPAAAERLAGRRVRSSFVGGPFDGPEDVGSLERCISRGVPASMIPVMYGNSYQFVQAPGWVAITYEIVHEARVIPLDGRAHVGAAIRAHMGDARGRWDGDTLVVETTNVTPLLAYRSANPATLTVTERFRRVAPDRIEWTATIEDPETWTRPWTIAMPLTADRHPIYAFDCHEHNHGLRNILSAARAEDAAPGDAGGR